MLSVLEAQGYTLEGTTSINGKEAHRLLSPASSTGNAGIILFQGKDEVWRVYSHHNADEPLSRTGEDASTSDAWDLFCIFDHTEPHIVFWVDRQAVVGCPIRAPKS